MALFEKITRCHSPIATALLVGHIVLVGTLGLRASGMLQPLELLAYDLLLWSRLESQPPDPRIVIVWFNDEDQRRLGYPLSDIDLAQLFEIILEHEPIVVGLDIYRDLPVPRDGGSAYNRLVDIFTSHRNIIAIKKFQDMKGVHVGAPPALKGTDRIGFNDLAIDGGGAIRRGLLYIGDEDGTVLEAFALKLALRHLIPRGVSPQAAPDNGLQLGKAILTPLPLDYGGYVEGDEGGFQFMLTYPRALNEPQNISVTEVLLEQFEPAFFKNKIVVIGIHAEATPDFAHTPFGRWLKGDQRMPGAAIHASIVSQLLDMASGESQPLQSWNELQEILWIWWWCVMGTLVCLWVHSVWSFSLLNLGGLVYICSLAYGAFLNNLWLLVAAPSIGWIIATAVMTAYLSYTERHQRTVLMQLFSKHVSKDVAKVIWEEREQYLNAGRLRSQRLIATVLFTDLQNFTTVSETMEPQELMDWLNQYMETMVSIVEKQHHGQVNKFIGDAIMAVFGVPIQRDSPEEIVRDAVNAVNCALSMRKEIQRLRTVWQEQGLPLIRMRVGIFTGPLVAGSLGGVERQEYTVLGDTVNVAARLESFDKELDAENPCRILIGETTLQLTDKHFNTERVGEVSLKGRHAQITIYRVLDCVICQPEVPAKNILLNKFVN